MSVSAKLSFINTQEKVKWTDIMGSDVEEKKQTHLKKQGRVRQALL